MWKGGMARKLNSHATTAIGHRFQAVNRQLSTNNFFWLTFAERVLSKKKDILY
jgi:hypothetical protein